MSKSRTKMVEAWRTLDVPVTPQMRVLLAALVKTGLYGCNIEDAARRLIEESLRTNEFCRAPYNPRILRTSS
jgi:hypothetical protein